MSDVCRIAGLRTLVAIALAWGVGVSVRQTTAEEPSPTGKFGWRLTNVSVPNTHFLWTTVGGLSGSVEDLTRRGDTPVSTDGRPVLIQMFDDTNGSLLPGSGAMSRRARDTTIKK